MGEMVKIKIDELTLVPLNKATAEFKDAEKEYLKMEEKMEFEIKRVIDPLFDSANTKDEYRNLLKWIRKNVPRCLLKDLLLAKILRLIAALN